MRGIRFTLNARRGILLVSLIAIGILTGPFGTYEHLSLSGRALYWTLAISGVGLFMWLAEDNIVDRPSLAAQPLVVRVAIASAAASLPGALVITLLETLLRPLTPGAPDYVFLWFSVAIIGFVAMLVQHSLKRYFRDRNADETAESTGAAGAFVARLPPEIGRDLVSLSMQDHYIEATTTAGRALVLMRFADALRELGHDRGRRIHRSHWVAEAHVRRVMRQDGKVSVALSDGRTLPASRTYAAEIEALEAALSGDAAPAPARSEGVV